VRHWWQAEQHAKTRADCVDRRELQRREPTRHDEQDAECDRHQERERTAGKILRPRRKSGHDQHTDEGDCAGDEDAAFDPFLHPDKCDAGRDERHCCVDCQHIGDGRQLQAPI
jgi:hypothetical protein